MEAVHALAASVLVAAAAWHAPAVVPASGHGVVQQLALAAGADGAATLVWSDQPRDSGAAVRALVTSQRAAQGAWSQPQALARAAWLSEPAVAADGSGALAAWATRRGSSVLVWVAERSGGRWSRPRVVDRGVVGRVPGASLLASLHLASNGHGRVALTWVALTPRRTFVLRALARTRARRWLPARTLGPATPDLAGPQSTLAIDAAGRTSVAWSVPGKRQPRGVIARSDAQGRFGPPHTLLAATVGGLALLPAADGSTWAAGVTPAGDLVTLRESPGGRLTRPTRVAHTGIAVYVVRLAAAGSRALVAWIAAPDLERPLHAGAALGGRSSSWGPPRDLGVASPGPLAAVFAGGTALVGWQGSGRTRVVRAADGTGELADPAAGPLALATSAAGATLAEARPGGIVTRVRR